MPESVELVFRFLTEGQEKLDQVTAQLDKVTKFGSASGDELGRLQKTLGDAGKQADGAGKSFSGLGDNIRNGLQNPVQSATGAVEGLLSKIGVGGVVIGGLGVAAGVAGKQIFDFVAAQGKAAEETVNLADRLGIAVGRTEQLQAQMRIAGVNAGALEGSVRLLSQALEDPTGAGEKTIASLRGIGVATHQVSGAQRELGPVLLDVLEKLSRISSDSERVAVAQRTLGRAGSVELLPWIKNLNDLDALVKSLGIGFDENLTKALAKTDDQFDAVRENLSELKKSLAAPLLVPVNSVLGFLSGTSRIRTAASRDFDNPNEPKFSPNLAGLPKIDVVTPDRQIQDDYLRSTRTTVHGLQKQLKDLNDDLNKQESTIFGIGAGSDAKSAAVKRAEALTGQITQIEEKIKQIGKPPDASRLPDVSKFFDSIQGGSPFVAIREAMLKTAEDTRKQIEETEKLGAELERSVVASAPNVTLSNGLDPGFYQQRDLAERGEQLTKEQGIRESIAKSEIEAAVRMVELGDNEILSAREVRDIRLSTAKDAAEYRQAELDFQVKLADLEKQRKQRYEDQARGVYRSLRQGGASGLGAFVAGQGDQLLEQLFVNVSGKSFQKFGSTLGKAGANSGLPDWLLKGTIFDPQNAAIDKNTNSLVMVTASLDRLNIRLGGGGAGITGPLAASLPFGLGGDTAATAIGLFGSDVNGLTGQGPLVGSGVLDKIVGKKAPSTVSDFLSGAGTVLQGGLFTAGITGTARAPGYASELNTTQRVGNIVGSVGAVAGAGFGIYQGIQEGGARGATTAVGSALGVAALIPGPQQPFVMAAALIAGMVKGLLPDPKKAFDEAQTRVLKANQFTGPTVQEKQFDVATGSDSFNSDLRGRTRVASVMVQNTFHISAVDDQSVSQLFQRNGGTIAKIVSDATRGGDAGMQIAINRVVFGPGAA